MGYESDYIIRVWGEHAQDLVARVWELDLLNCGGQELPDGSYGISVVDKWYSANDDLRKLARAFPTCTIVVERIGANPGDYERCAFQGSRFESVAGEVVSPKRPRWLESAKWDAPREVV